MLKIKLDNCCCEPNITMEFTFEEKYFKEILRIASGSFRSIEVTNNETGEVVYTRYVGDKFFQIEKEYGFIADAISELLAYTPHHPRGF